MSATKQAFLATTEELKRGGTSGAKSAKESINAANHLSLVKNPPVQLNWAFPTDNDRLDTVTCHVDDLFDLVVSLLRQPRSIDLLLVANNLKELFRPTKADIYRYVESVYCTPLQSEVGFLNKEASEVLDLLLEWI